MLQSHLVGSEAEVTFYKLAERESVQFEPYVVCPRLLMTLKPFQAHTISVF
jgi:hypothetical protein